VLWNINLLDDEAACKIKKNSKYNRQKLHCKNCPVNGDLTLMLLLRIANSNKKLSYCWETVRRESMPRTAEMDVEITT